MSRSKSSPAEESALADSADPFAESWNAAGRWRYGMLLLAVGAQLATLVIAWPVWNVREAPLPPNLPLLPLPELSFGWLLLVSLAAVPVWPRAGLAAHASVYAVACLFDMYRLQPQCISLLVLIAACLDRGGLWLGRWYLAALWFWAGLHKLLSPEWFGYSSWTYLRECGAPADDGHLLFAWIVALGELALAVGAVVAPRWAAWLCLATHLVILVSLSPLGRNYNVSVWPWNFATAVVGMWMLRQEMPEEPFRFARIAVALLFIAPLGFYVDWVNPHLAFVLYSGGLPRALHTSPTGVRTLHAWQGWDALNVPFPDSPALFVQAFERRAAPGDKLHIGDPRWALDDRYYVLDESQKARPLSREEFLADDTPGGKVAGRLIEDPQEVFALQQRGVQVVLNADGLVVGATFTGPPVDDSLLAAAAILTNLRQLTIAQAAISDRALATLGSLPHLEVLEIQSCPLTDGGLPHLAPLKRLAELHLADLPITSAGVRQFGAHPQLAVLRLPGTRVDDAVVETLRQLPALEWVDLARTPVTSRLLAAWQPPPNCSWINLSGTKVDDAGIQQLAAWPRLEVVELAGVKAGDASLPALARMPNLQHLDLRATEVTDAGLLALARSPRLQMLRLRGAGVTSAGVERLRSALPACTIDW